MGQSESNGFVVQLQLAGTGHKQAAADLLPLVYDELRKVAAVRLVRGAPQPTLQPTALVHEAYLRLVGSGDPGWNGKHHFFGAAAKAMRNILVDRAKHRGSIKHGGGMRRVGMDAIDGSPTLLVDEIDFVGLDKALTEFESVSPEEAKVVMLRYFAGLSEVETAQVMELSVTTVRRRWTYAKAWLHRKLSVDEM